MTLLKNAGVDLGEPATVGAVVDQLDDLVDEARRAGLTVSRPTELWYFGLLDSPRPDPSGRPRMSSPCRMTSL